MGRSHNASGQLSGVGARDISRLILSQGGGHCEVQGASLQWGGGVGGCLCVCVLGAGGQQFLPEQPGLCSGADSTKGRSLRASLTHSLPWTGQAGHKGTVRTPLKGCWGRSSLPPTTCAACPCAWSSSSVRGGSFSTYLTGLEQDQVSTCVLSP